MTDFVQLWSTCRPPRCSGQAPRWWSMLALAFTPAWAGTLGQPGAVVHAGAGHGPAGHGHGLPHLLLRGAVHPLPARPRRGGAGMAAVERRAHFARALGRFYRGGGAGQRRSRQRRGPGLGLGCHAEVVLSLAPKSVTAPVAMGIADKVGGIASLAAVFAVLTGLVGALSGKAFFALLGIGQTPPVGWHAVFALAPPPTASAPPACRCTRRGAWLRWPWGCRWWWRR